MMRVLQELQELHIDSSLIGKACKLLQAFPKAFSFVFDNKTEQVVALSLEYKILGSIDYTEDTIVPG